MKQKVWLSHKPGLAIEVFSTKERAERYGGEVTMHYVNFTVEERELWRSIGEDYKKAILGLQLLPKSVLSYDEEEQQWRCEYTTPHPDYWTHKHTSETPESAVYSALIEYLEGIRF